MKRYLLGIIAVVLAVCFSAFSNPAPKTDGFVYFRVVNGNFEDLDEGVQDDTPFECDGEDETCAKGYDPERTDVVIPNGLTTWTLLMPEAVPDLEKERDIIE